MTCTPMNGAKWIAFVAVLLAAVTAVLAMGVGRTLDDYMHPSVMAERGLMSMYDFLGPADVDQHRFMGRLPWWTSDELSMRFFRPLSSLDLAVDHLWLDRGGLLSHLHGLLWHLALLFTTHRLLSRLLDRPTAHFATALYAVAGWHTMPLAFVAARHATVTAVFALLSFYALVNKPAADTTNERVSPSWRSAALLLVALLAGESGLLVVPLMVGWAVARLGVRSALWRLWPTLLVATVYGLVYAASGLGARGSSLYLEPLSVSFLAELPPRWVALNADLFGAVATDLTLLGARPVQVVWGVLALGAGALSLRWLFGRDPKRARVLIGLACGAMTSCIFASAAMPGGRTLVIIGVAASALFGSALREVAQAAMPTWQRRWVLAWVAVFGIGLHPVIRTVLPLDLRRLGTSAATLAEELSRECRGRIVLGVGAMDMNVSYADYAISEQGLPRPSALHVVSMGSGQHTLSRQGRDEYELVIEGDFLDSPWARNHTREAPPVGSSWKLHGLSVELTRRQPQTHLRLDVPPEAELCWLTSTAEGLALMDFDETQRTWTPMAPQIAK